MDSRQFSNLPIRNLNDTFWNLFYRNNKYSEVMFIIFNGKNLMETVKLSIRKIVLNSYE